MDTPLGYFVAWFFQSAGIAAAATTTIVFYNFTFGSCWLFMVMAEEMTKELSALNTGVQANGNRAEWMACLCDLIQLHSDAKE